MRKIIILFLLIIPGVITFAQQRNFWTPVNETSLGKNVFAGKQRPLNYLLFRLQESLLKADLNNAPSETMVAAKASSLIITIPDEAGQPEQFRVVDAPVMMPGLAAKFPDRKSYAGVSMSNPATTIRFSYGRYGFNGVVLSPAKGIRFIERLDRKENIYVVGSQSNVEEIEFDCSTTGNGIVQKLSQNLDRNADDKKLRIYRLAIATNWRFSDAYSNDADPPATQRADIMEELNEQMTIVNAIFERDFGVRLVMIDNTEDLIYLDDDSDPFPNADDSDPLNNQAQTTITSVIGSANFDVGHLVRIRQGSGSGGNAGAIGSICNDATKARGFTGRSNWDDVGVYSEMMLTHEFGHQSGSNHVFTHQDENDIAQLEPGSGSTIMSYGGGSPDPIYYVVTLRDHYFAAINIQQTTDYLKGQGCGTVSDIENDPPTANAGADYTIPKSTPFMLTGTSSDPDNSGLTHTWEQMDKLTAAGDFPRIPASTQSNGPEFRSRPPVTDKFRVFPILANILDGSNTNTWEVLPSVTRDLNFRFTVRDNAPGNGQNESEDMVVHIDGDIGPFAVTSPNSPVTWCPGSHNVTWDANGSIALSENVKISLSTDGGLTFPTVLVASTANDGSQAVTITCTYSNTARIKVEAIGNIFFDISNTNFTIGDNTKPTFTDPPDITINKDANCNYNATVGVTGDVTDEYDNCDNTLNATFADATAAGSCVGETIITRTWTLTDDCNNSTVKTQIITITDITPPTFTEPDDITIYKDENCEYDASVGETGDVTDEADNCDNTLNATFTDVVVPGSCMGEEIITRTWSLTDDCQNNTTHDQVITARDTTRPVIDNVSADPSSLWPPNHKMRLVKINYTATDNCSDAAHITNVLSVTSNEPINGTGDGDTSPDWEVIDDRYVRLRAERSGNGDGRIYTITITSTDDCGNVASTTTTVVVVHNITGPNSGKSFKIGSTVAFSGSFWDKPGNRHTAKWIFDESIQATGIVTEPSGRTNGSVTGSYKFNTAGVYKVKMNITDQLGVTSYATTNGDLEEIVVIYDPNGGYTYGGGWFSSAAGALNGSPSTTGKANYGFTANRFKNAANPRGEAQFKFQVGDFEFNAINLEYLVIAGAKAQFKGTGKIVGGQSGISFIMTVLDGDLAGGGSIDKIRMKIFNKNTGYVYYDNQPGASDSDNPTTAVGTNSIIVVSGTNQNNNATEQYFTEQADKEIIEGFTVKVGPNPSNSNFNIRVSSDNAKDRVIVNVFDLYGRKIEEKRINNDASISIGDSYIPGVYLIRVTQGTRSKEFKLVKL